MRHRSPHNPGRKPTQVLLLLALLAATGEARGGPAAPSLPVPAGWQDLTSGSAGSAQVTGTDWDSFGPLLARCELLFAVEPGRAAFLCGARQPHVDALDERRLAVIGELMARAAGGQLVHSSLARVHLRRVGVVEVETPSGRGPVRQTAYVVCPPAPAGGGGGASCYSIAYGRVGDPPGATVPTQVEAAMAGAVAQLQPLWRSFGALEWAAALGGLVAVGAAIALARRRRRPAA
jgi:hypothetical protein